MSMGGAKRKSANEYIAEMTRDGAEPPSTWSRSRHKRYKNHRDPAKREARRIAIAREHGQGTCTAPLGVWPGYDERRHTPDTMRYALGVVPKPDQSEGEAS